jgi:hypothetical protein
MDREKLIYVMYSNREYEFKQPLIKLSEILFNATATKIINNLINLVDAITQKDLCCSTYGKHLSKLFKKKNLFHFPFFSINIFKDFF